MLELYSQEYLYRNKDKLNLRIARYNDSWFNAYYMNKMPVTDAVKHMIQTIDGVQYAGGYNILSKYDENRQQIISMMNLSTGCKTVINCMTFPEVIFSMDECGENALSELLKIPNGKLYFSSVPMIVWGQPICNSYRLFIGNEPKDFADYDSLCEGVQEWLYSL